MNESERTDYQRLNLERYATQQVHKRIKVEAERLADDFDELESGQWRDCVIVAALKIWRENGDFRKRCENDWEINPGGEKGRRRARMAALKEAENGKK